MDATPCIATHLLFAVAVGQRCDVPNEIAVMFE
jgi:hypothetical protein